MPRPDSSYQIREAAESLLSTVSHPNYRTISNSQSVNIVSEELVAGHRPHGRMSTVRRFFCLFVTFDLLFTGLMWLICVMMRGETLAQIFDREVMHYNVKASLFDVVLLAVIRFITLLLFYGVLYINNWSVIALSTGGTCAFLMAKVFVFDWPNASQPVYQVFLILTSFTLSWGEAWFLDFRVLPQELQAKEILDCITSPGAAGAGSHAALAHAPAARGDSTANWFSPVETPEASPRPRSVHGQQIILTQDQIEEYKEQAEACMMDAWRVIHLENWHVEKRGQKGDVVESKKTEFGKVYRFTGVVECPPKFLYTEFRDNLQRLPEWNPTILKSELIKEIAPGIDLSYQVTAGGGGNIIAPRDFVILRRTAALSRDAALAEVDDPYCYISSGRSVQVPGYPPCPKMVRGDNKVGCWFMKPLTVKSSSGKVEQWTTFQWLMCCDLKGKIPQFVLDTAFATVMLDYIVHVRKFVAEAKVKALF
ncbi:steroidogenic acute regulatory protein-like isoform X2 [Plodia interpunctella]|uniref:steroidogenic acute regulatory protein-like isoform X2 n=1 Tax=Plodia interpunctella TaxID=58824 RepID=UPI002368C876|nr:steroidogenic acute regulatory protein-like isoform X2 [Plodia interpunctella]